MSEAPAAAAAPPAERPKGPPPEQIQRTVEWATGHLMAWYRANPPKLPQRFGRREFGFIPPPRPPPDRTPFFRHLGVRDRHDLLAQLLHYRAWHAYYSTAYYETPAAPTMKEKEWLGADLIFDLDADHLQGAAEMSFEQQLAAVKKQAKRLLDDFLLDDLGFDADDVHVVFSGGRGYHFHVTDPRVQRLGSAERREIVDYISPPEGVLDDLIGKMETKRAFTKDPFTKRAEHDLLFPRADEPGWRGRFTRYVRDWLADLAARPREEALQRLVDVPGIGPKKAKEILDDLTPERIERVAEGRVTAIPGVRKNLKVLQQAFREGAIRFAPGETDEPVTADVKRLIRLPGSLHGKTGLRVTPLTLEAFDDFDPLRDAVALPETPVKVVVGNPETVPFAGARLTPEKGVQEMPLRHAMFLVLRRRALIPL